jgi:methylmalonyl-CoA mutase cobalamin-binding subunit
MPDAMTPDEVRELLEELVTRLNDEGITAGIRVVGGAALSILDKDRRSTSDIDAVIIPAGVAADIVTDLANERG